MKLMNLMQEEATAGSDEFQSTISSIKLPKQGSFKRVNKNCDWLTKEKAKGWACCIWKYVARTKGALLSRFVEADEVLKAITGRKITEYLV